MQPGDIVAIARGGRWVIVAPLPDGNPPRWRLIQWREPVPARFDAGEAGMTLVLRPAFEPGQVLLHWGREVEVIEDKGDLVRVFQQARKPVAGSAGIDISGDADASRWQLIAENVDRFV